MENKIKRQDREAALFTREHFRITRKIMGKDILSYYMPDKETIKSTGEVQEFGLDTYSYFLPKIKMYRNYRVLDIAENLCMTLGYNWEETPWFYGIIIGESTTKPCRDDYFEAAQKAFNHLGKLESDYEQTT